ncbi:roadblock/LC7 domain-containing protein [Streptomyces sp. NPDC055815]
MNPRNSLSNLGWVLDDLVRLPYTLHALLLSADGLRAASSQGVDRDMADRMSAAVSGMQALSGQAAEFANCQSAPWELTMIQYRDGYIFIMAAGQGTYLAVSAGKEADVESVSYAMEKAIGRVGQEMYLAARNGQGGVS